MNLFQPLVTEVKMFCMRNVQIIVLAPNQNLKKKLAHAQIFMSYSLLSKELAYVFCNYNK
jgi:hypothetical protein